MFKEVYEVIELIKNNIKLLIEKYFAIKSDTAVCVLVDKQKIELGLIFEYAIYNICKEVKVIYLESGSMHGNTHISASVFQEIKKADIVISLVSFSLAHTEERYELNKLGKKFVSMPDYTIGLLARDCFDVDFEQIISRQNRLFKALEDANTVEIKTKLGTDVVFEINNRTPNNCPGFVNENYLLASPPDFEVNIAVLEDKTQGVVVVDGSIPFTGFGLIKTPIRIEIKDGRIVSCDNTRLSELFNQYGDKSKIPAELGFGFNYKAELSGFMLEDEGCYNTFHIGFGSNVTIGGNNRIHFHLDAVVKNPSIKIDNKQYIQEIK